MLITTTEDGTAYSNKLSKSIRIVSHHLQISKIGEKYLASQLFVLPSEDFENK